jgi:ABC-type sulfate transport system permease component
MTLGAKPFQAFSKVLMPIIKSSIIAGAILTFTRSLGETGATQAIGNAVGGQINTVPVYIMQLINNNGGTPRYAEAAMCSIILILICFVLMFIVRIIVNRGGRRA